MKKSIILVCLCLAGSVQAQNIRYELVPFRFTTGSRVNCGTQCRVEWATGFVETDGTLGLVTTAQDNNPHGDRLSDGFVETFEITAIRVEGATAATAFPLSQRVTHDEPISVDLNSIVATTESLSLALPTSRISLQVGCCPSSLTVSREGASYWSGFLENAADVAHTPLQSDVFAVASSGVPGDANGDGTVDFPDFVMLSRTFGLEANHVPTDFDESGIVDFPDFIMLSNNYTATTNQPVPEPSTLALLSGLMFAAFSQIRTSRRRTRPLA